MKAWADCIEIPVKDRLEKPRENGLTMILDKGLGIRATRDLVETAADAVDVVKFSFGTSAFYSEDLCREKTDILKDAGVNVMPGGTFFEVALWKNKADAYLERAAKLGFDAVEISDGTIEIDPKTRGKAIRKAVDAGFLVYTEVGKKDPAEEISDDILQKIIQADLESGAYKVIVEAREGGKGVGIFDGEGNIKEGDVEKILSEVKNPEDLLWEAPLKNQQKYLILKLGVNVNLGNIPPDDILALEALRRGLRGDTLKKAYREKR